MSNQLSQTITADQLKTLEQAGIIPSNTPPAQVAVFAQICKEKGLSPFSKEAHLVGYGGNNSAPRNTFGGHVCDLCGTAPKRVAHTPVNT